MMLLVLLPCVAHGGVVELRYDFETDGYGHIAASDGAALAVRFTPPGGKVQIVKIQVRVWPHDPGCTANQLWILDNDGPESSPKTTLYGPVDVTTPSTLAWITIDVESAQLFVEDDFYVAYLSNSPLNTCGSLAYSQGDPGNRYWRGSGFQWIWLGETSVLFNIRAFVETNPVAVSPTTWGRLKLLPLRVPD